MNWLDYINQHQNAAQGVAFPNMHQQNPFAVDPRTRDYELLKWLAMRLRIPEGESFPWEFCNAHQAGEKVFLFIVTNNEAVTFEDSASLFPSDELVVKLKLIENK